jgi:hypothetical protein
MKRLILIACFSLGLTIPAAAGKFDQSEESMRLITREIIAAHIHLARRNYDSYQCDVGFADGGWVKYRFHSLIECEKARRIAQRHGGEVIKRCL